MYTCRDVTSRPRRVGRAAQHNKMAVAANNGTKKHHGGSLGVLYQLATTWKLRWHVTLLLAKVYKNLPLNVLLRGMEILNPRRSLGRHRHLEVKNGI